MSNRVENIDKHRAVLPSPRPYQGETSASTPMREEIFSDGGVDLIEVAQQAQATQIARAEYHTALLLSVDEMEHQMRRDFLTGNATLERRKEYGKLARDSLDTKTALYGFHPSALVDAWGRAAEWAASRSSDQWRAEDQGGIKRRFISERANGLTCALEELGSWIRFDVRLRVPQIRNRNGKWIELDDLVEATIRDTIAGVYSFPREGRKAGAYKAVPAKWSNAAWQVVRDAALADNQVAPFLEWLKQLPEWDQERRIDNWLAECGFEIDAPEELAAWSSRSILMVACIRARAPGTKHDTIPVLVGPQSCGKSTALAWLMPPEYRNEWFTDGLRLSADEKRRAEALQGAVIVEVAEMSGSTTADIESLKAFLSRVDDRVRLAYRRNPESHPRRCSIVGTANGSAILPNDPTGNRRFVALKIKAGSAAAVREYLGENHLQLWAEAWFMVNEHNEECFFPASLMAEQAEANELDRSADLIIEDAVRAWLETRMANTEMDYFRISEAAVGAGLVKENELAQQLPHREVQRLSRTLERLGCQPARQYVNGKRTRVWKFPDV